MFLKTAVNVDDAVDDIVRQFKGVSDGLMRKVVGSSTSPNDAAPSISVRNLSWHADEALRHDIIKTESSFSEYEEGDKDGAHVHDEVESSVQAAGWHSDNELNSKSFPPRVIKRGNEPKLLDYGEKLGPEMKSECVEQGKYPAATLLLTSDPLEDLVGMPPEVKYIDQSFFFPPFIFFSLLRHWRCISCSLTNIWILAGPLPTDS